MPKGSVGTSTTIKDRRKPSGPRLKLPPEPKRHEHYSRKEIQADAERMEWLDGDSKRANKMRTARSWEEVHQAWKVKCSTLKAAHAEKMKEYNTKIREETLRRRRLWDETIAYCEAHGLPSPRSGYNFR